MNHRLRASQAPRVTVLIAVVALVGLASAGALRVKARPAQDESRMVNYIHGRIYTNDPQHPWAQAFAIREGKITCIGTISHVTLECAAGDTRAQTIDLHEKFVMPGFNDAHVHLGYAGAGMLSVRLYGAISVDDLKKRVVASVATHKP